MPHRPKYNPRPDGNHAIPREFFKSLGCETVRFKKHTAYVALYRGLRYALVDTNKDGDMFTDYILICVDRLESGGCYQWVEVKTAEAYESKDHGLTKGEQWTASIVGRHFKIVVTLDDFIAVLDESVKGN